MPTVTVTVTDANGNVSAPASASWTVSSQSQSWPYKPFPGGLDAKARLGMRCPDSERDARRAEVQAAPATRQLRAWRIFVGGASSPWNSPDAEGDIIDWAIARNMLPVVSYKDTVSTSLQNATADYLQSKGVPIAVARHHEPRGDMTTAEYRSMQAVSSPIFKARSNLSFGPILNGYLISTTQGKAELATWLPTADADLYDWVGADFYQAAPDSVPSTTTPWPGERMRDFAAWLDTRGYAQHRCLTGEFNGNHGTVIADACEALLESDRYWLGMLFNSTTGNKGIVLTHDTNAGDRLGAFQAGISDARAYQ